MTTTGERMTKLETDVTYIKEKLDGFIDSADNKYASKLTEKIVYAMSGTILLTFIGWVIYIVRGG